LGIDGGGLDDLLGFCALGRERGTHKWLAWFHAWAHPSVLAKHKAQAARLEDFADDGDLTVVETLGDDVDEVAELVAMAHASGKLDKIGVDPHGLGGILDAIADAKVPAAKVVGISQGWKLTGAIKTAERRIAERMLVHNGSRLMAWSVGNARVIPQGNAVGITKQASGAAKIDPLMAMFNAVQLMALNPASTDKRFQMMFFGNDARATQ
jgi:phage terminase large subunit-like protein